MVCKWSATAVAMVMVVQMVCLKTQLADVLYVSNQNQRGNITKHQNDNSMFLSTTGFMCSTVWFVQLEVHRLQITKTSKEQFGFLWDDDKVKQT